MCHVNVAIPYLTLTYQSWKRHESVAMSNASNYPFLWNTKVIGVLTNYKPAAFTVFTALRILLVVL